MFAGCSGLTSLDLSGWDTIRVEYMEEMFAGCSGLTSLDLSSFDMSKLYDVGSDYILYDTDLMILKTPRTLGANSINLPYVYVDPTGRETSRVTADFLSTTLTRKQWSEPTPPTPKKYTATIKNGSGSGEYEEGDTVTITANTPENGKRFKGWKIESGTVTLADAKSANTRFTMPNSAVTVTAEYENIETPPTLPETPSGYFTLASSITGHKGVAYASVTAKLVALDGKTYPATVIGGDSLDGVVKKECDYYVSAPAGQYNLEVEATTTDGVTVSRSAVVKLLDGNQTKDINLPNGQAKLKVSANNDKKVLVGGLDSLILDDDGSIIDGAAVAEVTFVADSAESLKEKPEAAAIQAAAPAQNMEFYDFSIEKTVGGNTSKVTDTGNSAVTIVLPFDNKGKSNVKVYRYHNNAVDTLTEQESYAVGYITSASSSATDINSSTTDTSSSTTDINSSTADTSSSATSTSSTSDDSPAAAQPAARAEKIPLFWKARDVDWKNVLSNINMAQSGEHVNVITGAAFAVPGEVIQILTGTDKALALHLGKGTSVGIYGKNILNSAALGLTFAETADMPKAAKQGIAPGAAAVREFAIREPGDFPFPANIHFALGVENAGKTAYLYRYDADSKKLTAVEQFRVTADGHAMFTLTKGGSYLVAVSKNMAVETLSDDPTKKTRIQK